VSRGIDPASADTSGWGVVTPSGIAPFVGLGAGRLSKFDPTGNEGAAEDRFVVEPAELDAPPLVRIEVDEPLPRKIRPKMPGSSARTIEGPRTTVITPSEISGLLGRNRR
jgi:hypothetical protein